MLNSAHNILPFETIREIRKLNADPLNKAVFDSLARGKFHTSHGEEKSVTLVNDLVQSLNPEFPDCRSRLVTLLQDFEKKHFLGRFVLGRRGPPGSRILWGVDPVALGKAAQSTLDNVTVFGELKVKNINYEFQLRPDLKVTFELPADLTREEADRLSHFMKNCLIVKSP